MTLNTGAGARTAGAVEESAPRVVKEAAEGLSGYLLRERGAIDDALRACLPTSSLADARRLNEAVEYAVFPGGKRLRPALALLASNLAGAARAQSLRVACAVEFLHSSSLVLDDLPAMDDADMRRSRRALHLVFGEGAAVLASVAEVDPTEIRESVVDLGDGTYGVHFTRGGNNVFVRVDNEMPVWAGTQGMAYAGLGKQGSMWVAVMEKAYAFLRTGHGTYQSLESGWMDESYAALGFGSNSTYHASGAAALLNLIKNDLAAGKSVTFAVDTPVAGSNLVAYHAYTVDAVITNASGVPTHLRLRNPWGVDGNGVTDGANDGYVTVTAQQAYDSFLGFTSAAV